MSRGVLVRKRRVRLEISIICASLSRIQPKFQKNQANKSTHFTKLTSFYWLCINPWSLRKIHGFSEEDLALHLKGFEELFNGEVLGKKKYIRDLSKGNLKKVGIAAALLGHPQVVLLDEPFENLDPSSQIRLKKLILSLMAEAKTTFLISSHDLNHVTDLCDRIVLLEKGKVIRDLCEKGEMLKELEAYFVG